MKSKTQLLDEHNPIVRLVEKQKVGRADADQIALPVLISLDAAKRAAATPVLANNLTKHLLIALAIWNRLAPSKPQYAHAVAGFNALVKACQRPTELLDLTTTEYKEIRTAVNEYLRALPQIEIGVMSWACKLAESQYGVIQGEP